MATLTPQEQASIDEYIKANPAPGTIQPKPGTVPLPKPSITFDASKFGTSVPLIPEPFSSNSAQNSLTASLDSFLANKATSAAADPKTSILNSISSLIGLQSTQGEKSLQYQQEEGVFDKKTQMTNLENEILAKQKSYDKQAEKIRQNAEGTFGGAVDQNLANLDRQKNSELADLAIQYKVAEGAYSDAVAIAEAKIKAEFEPIDNQIQSLQTLYSLYQDDLTASEKLQAQTAIENQQAARDFEYQKQLTAYKSQIEQADPLYQAQVANIYSQIADRNAASSTGGTDMNELLSVDEAKKLGVPYGTTRGEAIGKRSLSATQQETQVNATSALTSLSNLTQKITNEKGQIVPGKLVTFGLGQIAYAQRELKDVISRVRTGAALTESEESFYAKQVPRAVDTPETIRAKLNQLAAFYSGLAGNSVTIQLPDGSYVVADDMFDPETRTEVRKAITSGANIINY